MDSVHFSDIRENILNHFFRATTDPHELIRRFVGIQIDPVSIVCANQLLVLGARGGSLCSRGLSDFYDNALIIEVYAKERCLVSREDAPLIWPLLCARRERKKAVFTKHKAELVVLRQLIRERGPISAGELDSVKLEANDVWGPKQSGTMLLNLLWEIGELIVASRKGRVVTYTLPPSDLWHSAETNSLNDTELRRARWKRYLDGVAITDSRDTFAGFERCGVAERRKLLDELVDVGDAVRVVGLSDRVPHCIVSKRILLDVGTSNQTCLPCFIPPLDNFIWHRPLVKDMWGFDYRWEIYTLAERRKFGPYAMPLVTPQGVFGPVDFRFDRKSGRLIGNISTSPLSDAQPKVKAAAEAAAHKLAQSIGADTLSLC